MSTFFSENIRWAVCGQISEVDVMGSSNSFGSPDLDLRPAAMLRYTMRFWVQECPHCGYVAAQLDAPTAITHEWLQSDAYQQCEGLCAQESMVRRFYRQAMIDRHLEQWEDAFFALLHGAWCCDDLGDDENARYLRTMALEMLERMRQENPWHANLKLIRADVLRRAGQFDRLLTEYADCVMERPVEAAVLAFQLECAKRGDTGCYRIDQVPGLTDMV